MCARLYGRRGARNRAMRAVTADKQAEPVEVVADGWVRGARGVDRAGVSLRLGSNTNTGAGIGVSCGCGGGARLRPASAAPMLMPPRCAATRCTRPPPPWPRNTGWSWSKRSTLPACVALVGPANVASTVPWLMPPWPRCGACSAAKLVGTVPIWRKPTGIFRRRRPARAVGGESQTSRWPIESSTASTAARGSIVIWVLRSTSPDSANPTGVNRVPPGVARWQDVEPRMRPNAPAGDAAGNEASTPHHHHPVDQTGTASPQGETA